jgi:hypothetical protein
MKICASLFYFLFLLIILIIFQSSSRSYPSGQTRRSTTTSISSYGMLTNPFHFFFHFKVFFPQAIQFYEQKIRNEKEPLQIAQYYINIGHWHLLLEDFDKGKEI